MPWNEDLYISETVEGVRSKLITYAQTASLIITDWLVGGPGQQIFESVSQTIATTTSVIAAVVRGYASLDTSTDPGDVDPFDEANASRAPVPGMLSHYGANTFGTKRQDETFATGFFTFDNSAGVVPRTFGPDALDFTWTTASPPSPAPTYKNAADSAIYTNPDGTVTVAAGAVLEIPVRANEAGSRSNAPPSALTLTTSMTGPTGTNAAAILGRDRESAPTYRERCRQAPSRTSLGGPTAAYAYLARTNLDGTALLNANGDPVNISRVQVTQDSTTGIVRAFFGSPSGAAIGEDVDAANENIQSNAFAVPDAITYTGAAAEAVDLDVEGTAKIKAGPGVVNATVRQAIVDALALAFTEFPIGGVDQVDGAGVIYTDDLQAIAANACPGLYAVNVSTPAGNSTPLTLGQVAIYLGTIADWSLTVVSSS